MVSFLMERKALTALCHKPLSLSVRSSQWSLCDIFNLLLTRRHSPCFRKPQKVSYCLHLFLSANCRQVCETWLADMHPDPYCSSNPKAPTNQRIHGLMNSLKTEIQTGDGDILYTRQVLYQPLRYSPSPRHCQTNQKKKSNWPISKELLRNREDYQTETFVPLLLYFLNAAHSSVYKGRMTRTQLKDSSKMSISPSCIAEFLLCLRPSQISSAAGGVQCSPLMSPWRLRTTTGVIFVPWKLRRWPHTLKFFLEEQIN